MGKVLQFPTGAERQIRLLNRRPKKIISFPKLCFKGTPAEILRQLYGAPVTLQPPLSSQEWTTPAPQRRVVSVFRAFREAHISL